MLTGNPSVSAVKHFVMGSLDYLFSIHELLISRHLGNVLKYFVQ